MEEVKIRVRYEETDQMGVVYHGKYFVWFEVGRTELFRAHNLPYTVLEENQVYLPVTEAHCSYKESARYDDELIIETEITRLSPVRIVFSYRVLDGKRRVLAEGGTTHAFLNDAGRPLNVMKKFPWLWEKLKDIAELDN